VRLHFAVRDSGMGIPLEDQSRLFQEFEQLDSSPPAATAAPGWGWPSRASWCA
jgi:signal transduction histidine kinase